MSAPRRWREDPDADRQLREILRGAPRARSLDPVTRRRLGAKVARVSALPAAAAGWLFVKSAAAALGVVVGSGAIAVSTGVVDWSPRAHVESPAPAPTTPKAMPRTLPAASALRHPEADVEPAPDQVVSSTPSSQAAPATSTTGTLSAEATLLERARRELRSEPELALSIAIEHRRRFPLGQLTSERTLIQLEALHRLGRDAEARVLARGLLGGPSAKLYAERIEQLLGAAHDP